MKLTRKKLKEMIKEELLEQRTRKWAVKVVGIGMVIVDAPNATDAKRMVGKKLRGGIKDVESVTRAFPAKKVKDIGEE